MSVKLLYNHFHEFPIFLAPRTCFDLYQLGIRTSGNYFIDPDGPYAGDYPVSVYCDLNSGNLNRLLKVLTSHKTRFTISGTTKINHDQVGEISVDKCREQGCSVHRVTYEISESQIAALATLSENCEQHFRVSSFSFFL